MSRGFGKTIGGEFASGRATTRAQAAALQVRSICPAFPQHARRRSQYLQSATPPHLPIDTADLPSRSYRTVARCCRSGMTLGEFGSQCVLVRVAVTKPLVVMGLEMDGAG